MMRLSAVQTTACACLPQVPAVTVALAARSFLRLAAPRVYRTRLGNAFILRDPAELRDGRLMSEISALRPPVPLEWQVNGLKLAGLSWGSPSGKPLLALHGWLDNAASFSQLAHLLTDFYVVAVDLTGHGQSARRSQDANYQIWDDLPEILGILDALEWNTFDLVGHSRGAIIATLLASAYPERVRHLVLLDAVTPQPVEDTAFPRQMRKALDDKPGLLIRANRIFADSQEAVASRIRKGLSESAAKQLVERNLRTCSGGMTWTTDPRLHGASAVKLTEAQIRAVLKALLMPTLLMRSGDAAHQTAEYIEFAQRNIDDLVVRTIKGGHHFHMESGANEVAQYMEQFLLETNKMEPALL